MNFAFKYFSKSIMNGSMGFHMVDGARSLHGAERQQQHQWSPSKQLEFISMASQLRSLLPACVSILEGVENAFVTEHITGVSTSWIAQADQESEEVSDQLALVTSLVVLETIAKCESTDITEWECSDSGKQSTLRQIAQSAGLSITAHARPLTCSELWNLMVSTSFVQVQAARDTCIAALISALTTGNCFTMLQTAQRCCAPSLHQAAFNFIMENFYKAVSDDVDGLNALDRKTLESLLASDKVQASEVDVFRVLMSWSQAQIQKQSKQRIVVEISAGDSESSPSSPIRGNDTAPASTTPTASPAPVKPSKEMMEALGQEFVSMCQACVRPGLMTIEQLEQLDGDQEVADNEWALSLVARWYLGHVMGHGFNQHASWNKPRKLIAATQ